MKNFIQKWILHNLPFKILAIVLAMVLWLLFSNMEDPIITTSFTVPVEVEHLSEFQKQNRYVEIEGEDDPGNITLDVYLRARGSVIESLRNRSVSSFLSAYIDLYELNTSESSRLIIHYNLSPAVRADLYTLRNQSYFTVQVEETMSREIPVTYQILGTPADGYLYLSDDDDIQVNPSRLTVTGPQSQVELIDHGYVTIRVDGASANVNKVGAISLMNEANELADIDASMITTSVGEVSVFVPIYTRKTVGIQPYLSGKVADGYEYTGNLSTDIDSVEIFGQESTLNKISSIALPEIDLSQITGSYTITYPIQDILDDAYGDNVVRPMAGNPDSVTVTFSVEEQRRETFSVKTSDITITGINQEFSDRYEFVFNTQEVELELYGLSANLEEYDPANLKVALRLKEGDLTEGIHTLPLEITGLGALKCDGANVSYTITAIQQPEDSSEQTAE